jgi:hypothetical protein
VCADLLLAEAEVRSARHRLFRLRQSAIRALHVIVKDYSDAKRALCAVEGIRHITRVLEEGGMEPSGTFAAVGTLRHLLTPSMTNSTAETRLGNASKATSGGGTDKAGVSADLVGVIEALSLASLTSVQEQQKQVLRP